MFNITKVSNSYYFTFRLYLVDSGEVLDDILGPITKSAVLPLIREIIFVR